MWLKNQFKTTIGKIGFMSEIVPILRAILWAVRFVLEMAGDKEEAETLMQHLPQFITAPWFAVVFLVGGLLLIWWSSERSTHRKLSATEIERKGEVERQLSGLAPAEMEVVRFVHLHGTAQPHQIIAHLRSKGFDEADRLFNNFRSRTTLITTVEGMSGSAGINPTMKDLLEIVFFERQAKDEDQQVSDPAASRKSWLIASAAVLALIIVVAGSSTLITSRAASRAMRKQESAQQRPAPPTGLRVGVITETPMLLREGKIIRVSKSAMPCSSRKVGYGVEGMNSMSGPDPKKPWLVLEPIHYQFVDWSGAPSVDLLFQVELTNRGESSIVKGWELCLIAPDQTPMRFRADKMSSTDLERMGQNSISLADIAFTQPVEHGKAVTGWVLFHLPREVVKLATLQGSLRCRDYLDHLAQVVFSTEEATTAQKPKHKRTLAELFKKDFPGTASFSDKGFDLKDLNGQVGAHVDWRLLMDFVSKTEFIAFYIPPVRDEVPVCLALIDTVHPIIDELPKHLDASGGFAGESTGLRDLTFSGRVFIYHEWPLSNKQKADIVEAYSAKGLDVQFRGVDYLASRTDGKQRD
jgi:hypothetical protein